MPTGQPKALRQVRRAAVQSTLASERRDASIRDALNDGCTIRETAEAAGLSPARVHQIRYGK
jgi:hypothetical protein